MSNSQALRDLGTTTHDELQELRTFSGTGVNDHHPGAWYKWRTRTAQAPMSHHKVSREIAANANIRRRAGYPPAIVRARSLPLLTQRRFVCAHMSVSPTPRLSHRYN